MDSNVNNKLGIPDTHTMESLINSCKDIDHLIDNYNYVFDQTNFVSLLNLYLEESPYEQSELSKRAYIDSAYCYQIFKGIRQPSRKKLIQICIGMSLNIDKTNRLLTLAGRSKLYAKSLEDVIVIYGITNGLSLMDIEEMMYDKGLTGLID